MVKICFIFTFIDSSRFEIDSYFYAYFTYSIKIYHRDILLLILSFHFAILIQPRRQEPRRSRVRHYI
jgi:hypothetical protein